jgi:hypothetical protein
MQTKLLVVSSLLVLAGLIPAGRAGLPTNADWVVAGQADSNFLGRCVAEAGDVNGDGYADVIISAPNYDNNRGKAYVFLGSATGLQTATNWSVLGENTGDYFGFSAAGVGDVNGDGYADVLVGAKWYTSESLTQRGKAYLFLGSAAGLAVAPTWSVVGEAASNSLGYAVAGAGDVNGDGYADVMIGAPLNAGGGSERGKAYVFLGSATGLAATTNWTAVGETNADDFGCSVAGAGDVNGDGYADVIVGADLQDGGGTNRGKAYVFLGGASGVQTAANWTAVGENNNDTLGRRVAGAGDVNGDGYADVIVGADQFAGGGTNRGKVYVFLGGASGVQSPTNWSKVGENDNDHLGYAAAGAGDVNGDGYAEVAVGAYLLSGGGTNRGKAYLFLGSAGGVQSATNWAVVGDADSNQFGYCIAGAGDVNGDGYGDLLVGADAYHGSGMQRGKACAFYGGADSLPLTAAFTHNGEADNNNFGYCLANAGDVNGDGYADMVVGAYQYNNYQGKAYLFLGSATGIQASASWTYTGQDLTNLFGMSVAGAGDVNGDGYADVIVGAKWYTGGGLTRRGKAYLFLGSSSGLEVAPIWTVSGENAIDAMGCSVAGAGDVNGDGYADVIVGAEGYASRGKAYVFLGNSSGLQAAPSWTVLGEPAAVYFASCVSGAGDVNGDGYADVIVSDEVHAAQRGKAYVFLGSANGLQTQTNWTAVGENASDRFGRIVAPAGDVNGDGYADILVNAYAYPTNSGRGKAYVFLGSPAGPQTGANWTAVGENGADYFGSGLAGAGDVNGDGYADVIAGAYSAGAIGKAYLFLGGAAGLQTVTNWTAVGESGIDDFGNCVAGAGDVNGDGFADVLVGAPRQEGGGSFRGKAYAYYGNSSSGRLVRARQTQLSGRAIQPWGLSTNASTFKVVMNATRPSGRSRAKLEVQTTLAGRPLGGPGTLTNKTSVWADTAVAAGGIVVTNTVTGLTPGAPYHWRARVLYAGMGATNGAVTNPPLPPHGPWRYFHGQPGNCDVRMSEPRLALLGSNGAIIASGEAASSAKGTDFGSFTLGASAVTNPLVVSNSGNLALSISGVTTGGAGGAYFALLNLPSSLASGAASNVLISFAPTVAGTPTAIFAILNNGSNTSFELNVRGAVEKISQTITFPAIADQTPTNIVGLAASASSGLPVSFLVASGPAQVSGTTNLSFTATGRVSIVASQAGDANWNAAPNVTNSFNVTGGSQPPLPAPQNLAASDGRYADQVALTWNMAGEATGYTIWRHTANDSAAAAQIGTATQTNYADTSAAGGTVYYYWVKATNAAATSAFSASDSGWRRSVGSSHYADVDIDGDRKADLVIFDPLTGAWRAKLSASGYAEVSGIFGDSACTLVPGDYDGDRLTDPGIYQEASGKWQVMLSASGYAVASATLGGMGYAPTPGDFDGDRKTDPGIYGAADGSWRVLLSASGYAAASAAGFGGSKYLPVQRDYDGDLKCDPAIYQFTDGTWQVMLSGSGYGIASATGFGGTGFAPVVGDYDADGRADPALYHEATGLWAVMLSGSGYLIATGMLGGTGYAAMPGDYDGDGKTDPAVYNTATGEWLVMLSGSGYGIATATFGGAGYDPVGFRPE